MLVLSAVLALMSFFLAGAGVVVVVLVLPPVALTVVMLAEHDAQPVATSVPLLLPVAVLILPITRLAI